MKTLNLIVGLLSSSLLIGCMSVETGSPSSTNVATSGLSGGFTADEQLIIFQTSNVKQRRGFIEETGDYYNYGPAPRELSVVPAEVPYSTDIDVSLTPKRVTVIAGCSTDKITDKTSCKMNIRPHSWSKSWDGGLIQTVSSDGSLLSSCVVGHDFPGRRASIRVDKNPSITTNKNGCISGSAARRFERQLKSGKILITRRIEWPYDYEKDKEMVVEGSFSTAQDLFRWTTSADLVSLFD